MSARDPEEITATGAPASAELPPDTTVGAVHLTVADLDRSIDYYENAIRLGLRERAGDRAMLGAGGDDLLVLHESPGARPADGYSGLYHFALLVPERVDLAGWLAHGVRDRVPLVGLSDHFVSEAIYLSDPDHHGIEIYWDRPREVWEGQVGERLTTMPLDTTSLLSEFGDPMSARFDALPGGTVMGHVHLRVANVPDAVSFYCDTVGFGLMAALGGHAAFLSAGGYHHHLGANSWESAGRGQAPDGYAKLQQATIVLPDAVSRDQVAGRIADAGQEPIVTDDGIAVRDPSGNPILLTV
ncbi:MAG: catechol 2,3-dioxygenase [Gaiellales bacterium]|jgi:catechol 2,3-dioxygenase|nr:catechol 2,3-dioxygenase [Gaiellales bacterium]